MNEDIYKFRSGLTDKPVWLTVSIELPSTPLRIFFSVPWHPWTIQDTFAMLFGSADRDMAHQSVHITPSIGLCCWTPSTSSSKLHLVPYSSSYWLYGPFSHNNCKVEIYTSLSSINMCASCFFLCAWQKCLHPAFCFLRELRKYFYEPVSILNFTSKLFINVYIVILSA